MDEVLRSSEGDRRSLAIYSGARLFALLTSEGEVEDESYQRVPGRITDPREAEGGGWAVWNEGAVEFPPFQSDGEAEVRWLGILDLEGVELARVPVEPFRVVARVQPRFAIGKIAARAGVG